MATPSEKRVINTMEPSERTQIELMKGYVHTEKCRSQVLRVVSGTAWVSMDGEDIVLNPGDEFKLAYCEYRAVVSPVGNLPLVYEFEE